MDAVQRSSLWRAPWASFTVSKPHQPSALYFYLFLFHPPAKLHALKLQRQRRRQQQQQQDLQFKEKQRVLPFTHSERVKEKKTSLLAQPSSVPPYLLISDTAMAAKPTGAFSPHLFILFSGILLASLLIPGLGSEAATHTHQEGDTNLPKLQRELQIEGFNSGLRVWRDKNARRLMIGSTAPTCSYNECRGCRFRCRAEQVPVDANDPINSAYHYRCVCHR